MLKYNDNITQEELKNILEYNKDTGIFTWKIKVSDKVIIGNIAGTIHKHGYINITFNNKIYKAHRLAWLYIYGKWPLNLIDHINGIRHDNKLINLREANHQKNGFNRKKQQNNKSGYKGIYWNKQCNKWHVSYRINGKTFYGGLYVE